MKYILVFILGCSLASFFKVVIDRTHYNEAWWKGYSYCPYCHHRLYAKDLIPILSQIYLKNKCSYCYHTIGWNYLFSEIFGGLSFSLITYFTSPNLELWMIISWCILWTSAWSDFLYYELNLYLFYPLVMLWMILALLNHHSLYYENAIFFIICSYIIEKYFSESMGSGDYYMLAWLSLQFDVSDLIKILFISSTAACIYAMLTMNFKQKIPFISYLSLGVLSLKSVSYLTFIPII